MNNLGNMNAYDIQRVVRLTKAIRDRVATSMGPDGRPSFIQFTSGEALGSPNDGVFSTKDGFTILSAWRTNDIHEQSIINTTFETIKLNNDSSGDGTTTAYVFFAELFGLIYDNVYSKYCENKPDHFKRKLTAGQFSKLMKKAIKAINQRTSEFQRTIVTDYDKLKEIAIIALNHDDEMLTPMANLLDDLKKREIPPSFVNIHINKTNKTSSSHTISGGFTFSGKLHLRESTSSKVERARLLYIGDSIRTMDTVVGIQDFMYATVELAKQGEKFILVADDYDDIRFDGHFDRTYAELLTTHGLTERHVFITTINNKRGIPHGDYINDLHMYFGSTVGIHNFNVSQRKETIDAWAMAKAKTLIETKLAKDNEEAKSMIEKQISEMSVSDIMLNCHVKFPIESLPLVAVDRADVDVWLVVKRIHTDTSESSILNNNLAAHISRLQKDMEETRSMEVKQRCILRLENLVQSFATIEVGGTTATESESLFSATLDAVKAVNSAAKVGVVSGMMIPTFISAHELLVDEALILKACEAQNITSAEEREVFVKIMKSVKDAASFISYSIMKNAELSDVEIKEVQCKFIEETEKAKARGDKKMPLIGFDVLDMCHSDKIISPFESEKAYVAGLTVVHTFMTPALFIHVNEIEANLAKENSDKKY